MSDGQDVPSNGWWPVPGGFGGTFPVGMTPPPLPDQKLALVKVERDRARAWACELNERLAMVEGENVRLREALARRSQ